MPPTGPSFHRGPRARRTSSNGETSFTRKGISPERWKAYQAILQSGFESPDLFYNLGNAYFKTGDLGRSILNYEKALRLRPRDPDTQANLELARSITADEIEPLPRFWVLSAVAWWVELFPRRGLALTVALAYLFGGGGLCVRILSQGPGPRRIGSWVAAGAGLGLLLFGTTLLAREGALGGADWGIILVEEVAVQSAPSEEDDLTLFHVHEGTKVRLDKTTDLWSEIVLEDGRVGWIPSVCSRRSEVRHLQALDHRHSGLCCASSFPAPDSGRDVSATLAWCGRSVGFRLGLPAHWSRPPLRRPRLRGGCNHWSCHSGSGTIPSVPEQPTTRLELKRAKPGHRCRVKEDQCSFRP